MNFGETNEIKQNQTKTNKTSKNRYLTDRCLTLVFLNLSALTDRVLHFRALIRILWVEILLWHTSACLETASLVQKQRTSKTIKNKQNQAIPIKTNKNKQKQIRTVHCIFGPDCPSPDCFLPPSPPQNFLEIH